MRYYSHSLFCKYAILEESSIISDFCCQTFFVSDVPDLAGQGFSNNCLRFGLEGGLQAELRFCGDRCEVWLRHCPPDKAAATAGVYGPLLEELVTRLGRGVKK